MSQLSDYQRMVELTAKFQQQHAARYAAEARVRVLEGALDQAATNLETAARLYGCPGCVEAAKSARAALAHGSGK